MSDDEPLHLRYLNVSSAKTGSWVLRVALPEQDSFEYGSPSNRRTMHTFACKLVGPHPAGYAQGTLKSPLREQIERAKRRFLHGSLWRISKVALDSEAKAKDVPAPQKHVILMGAPTRFKRVPEGIFRPLPFVPFPIARISNILKLMESKKIYDVAGVLISGPTNSRTANAKRGSRRAADFQLVQMSRGPIDELEALDFTAWEGLIAQLEPLVGQHVALFKLEVSWLAPGQVSCAISWGASVAKLEPDWAMAAFIEEYTSGARGGPVMVTTRCTPSEPAFDKKAPGPLLRASVWTVLAQTDGEQQSILQQLLHGPDVWLWVSMDPAWWDGSCRVTARNKLHLICNLAQTCKAFSVVYRAGLRNLAMEWMENQCYPGLLYTGMTAPERLRLCAMRKSFPDYKAELKARRPRKSNDADSDSDSLSFCDSCVDDPDSRERPW